MMKPKTMARQPGKRLRIFIGCARILCDFAVFKRVRGCFFVERVFARVC